MHQHRRITVLATLTGVAAAVSACVQAARPTTGGVATSAAATSEPVTAPPTPAQPVAPQSPATSQAASRPAATQPAKAPAFSATTLAGTTVRFPQDYHGKLVLVSFWATWCPHCRNEIQFWRAAYEKYHPAGLEMIGLASDKGRGGTAAKVAEFLKQQNLIWPIVFDDAERLGQLYQASRIPMSFLVDGDTGEIVAAKQDVRKDALLPAVAAELAAKNASAHPVATSRPAAQ